MPQRVVPESRAEAASGHAGVNRAIARFTWESGCDGRLLAGVYLVHGGHDETHGRRACWRGWLARR
jgi:hypothetical protein